MEDFVGRRDLLTRDEIKALSVKSDWAGFVQLASHVCALAASTTLLIHSWGTWWALPSFVLQGALLNWLYCGQHELCHGTVFRAKWLNEWAGRIIGFLQIYPRDFDRIQHFAHHRHTGDWARDPELDRKPFTLFGYLRWFLGVTYWYTRIARLFRLLFGVVSEPYIPEAERARIIREARWHLALYGLIAILAVLARNWAPLILWLAPLLTTRWTYMLQGTLEHLGRPHNDNLFDNTRSARAPWLFRWLGWNMQYHTAHHLFPSVPFHRLPALHRAMCSRLGGPPPTMGYLEFQQDLLGKLARGRERSDHGDDTAWVASAPGPARGQGARRAEA